MSTNPAPLASDATVPMKIIKGYEVTEHDFDDAPGALLALAQEWLRRYALGLIE